MSTTSSSSAGGGDTEVVHLTKAQLEDVVNAVMIARGAADDAKRMQVAMACQMYSQKWTTRIISDELERYYEDCNP